MIRNLTFMLAACLLAVGLAACGDDDTEGGDGGEAPSGDAASGMMTSTPDAAGGGGPPEPMFTFDGSIPDGMAPFCTLLVGAECDGDEDCSGGQVCCGDFNMGGFTYDKIACQDTCDPMASQYKLCHPGEECPTPGRVCEHSSIIPYDDYAVCKMAAGMAEPIDGADQKDKINCGAEICNKGQKCCLRVLIDLSNGLPDGGLAGLASVREVLDPYCVALEDTCECDLSTGGDGGTEDGG
jgi:hypothetical protein